MREFKACRVWLKSLKEMCYFDFQDIYKEGFLQGENEGSKTWSLKNKEKMYYIGIEDKNNIPIYEDDIVKTKWQSCGVTNWEFQFIGKVFYNLERLSFGILSLNENHSRPFHNHSNEKLLSIEVIGNIYETPNLLQGNRHEA